ncbi:MULTISPECIES: conjugal transfer protein TraL [Gammaproteobacteria]|uniref:Conjugal transfer protein TraL n=1 Tax=Vibrio japonicus TaxID=1824638 RepID=A0ABY5LR26_9VIBR|nr:conjugal transfer protein TraL [Vibrio japonicus]UUM33202.1 conjugal transfer protein TraL [Vibrio japonicus]
MTTKQAKATEATEKKESASMKNTVHFILQGKGGIGKSFISALLAQYIKTAHGSVSAFDIDQVNATLAAYDALKVTHIPVMKPDNNLDQRKFDNLVVAILETEEPCVIDSGANTFLPLLQYMVENDVFEMLKESGKRVYIHSIIGGGDNLRDTANGFHSIIKGISNTPVVLWLNEHFGTTDTNGKEFTETTLFKESEKSIAGLVTLHERNKDTFGLDIKEMTEARLTIEEAIATDRFNIMQKQRIKTVARDVFGQLEKIEF